MVAVVTPGDLSPAQFSIGGEVPNQITVRQDFIAASGAGAPTAAPAADASPFYVDTSTTPQSLYHWDGAAWNLLGDGTGAAQDGVVDGATLSGANVLTLTRSVGADITVDLSALAGGGGGGGVNGVTGTSPIQVGGTAANPVVAIDLAALVTALCADNAFQDCIKSAAVDLIRENVDGSFTAAHDTDGNGNYVYNDCP